MSPARSRSESGRFGLSIFFVFSNHSPRWLPSCIPLTYRPPAFVSHWPPSDDPQPGKENKRVLLVCHPPPKGVHSSTSYTTSNIHLACATQQQVSECSYTTEAPGAIGAVKTVISATVDARFETKNSPRPRWKDWTVRWCWYQQDGNDSGTHQQRRKDSRLFIDFWWYVYCSFARILRPDKLQAPMSGREGNDLHQGQCHQLGGQLQATLVFGRMNEPPSVCAYVTLTSLAVTEYFHNVES